MYPLFLNCLPVGVDRAEKHQLDDGRGGRSGDGATTRVHGRGRGRLPAARYPDRAAPRCDVGHGAGYVPIIETWRAGDIVLFVVVAASVRGMVE